MYGFKVNDTVTFSFKGKETYGIIQKIGKKNAKIWVEDLYEDKTIPIDRLTFVPPVILTQTQIRRLCRYEVKMSELRQGQPDEVPVILETPYTITFEDVLIAARNILDSGDDNDTVRDEWFYPLYEFMFESEMGDILFEETPAGVGSIEYLPDRKQFLNELFYSDLDNCTEPVNEFMPEIISHIECFIAEEKKPVLERKYSDEVKEHYISMLGNDDRLKKATGLELAVYRKFIEDLILKDNHTALKRKGYGCYGGDPAYECDWNTSLKCVTRLYELTGKPVYANTLGYIYYYGRCWNGEPKYDEAFKYFSVGAAGFYYESRYKLADMFVHGYGVPENKKIAFSLVSELYDQNLEYMLDGKFDCKFADIALRLGSYTEKGYGGYVSEYHAYRLYLQADFAIRQRLQYDHYGDLSVADSIRQRLNSILESGKIKKPVKSTFVDLDILLENYLKKYRKLQATVKKLSGGDLKLTIRITPFQDEKYPQKLFITEMDTGFCGMLETLSLRVINGSVIEPKNTNGTIYFDNIICYYDDHTEADGIRLLLGDKLQTIIVGKIKFRSPVKKSGRKYRFASVYFTPGGKHYDYLLDIDDVKAGDVVTVITDRGRTEVTVAAITEKTESELTLPIGKYKKILRKI